MTEIWGTWVKNTAWSDQRKQEPGDKREGITDSTKEKGILEVICLITQQALGQFQLPSYAHTSSIKINNNK